MVLLRICKPFPLDNLVCQRLRPTFNLGAYIALVDRRSWTTFQRSCRHGPECSSRVQKLTYEEVLQIASDEGLTLVESPERKSGYSHIYTNFGYYVARPNGGKVLGSYSSAYEAALAYARHLGPCESAKAQRFVDMGRREFYSKGAADPLTHEEVMQIVFAEGLTLVTSRPPTRVDTTYKNVHVNMGKNVHVDRTQ